jgi:hypothetical protein
VAWKAQADLFLATVKGKGFHFYVVDYEKAFNQLSKRTIAEVAEMVKYIKAQSGMKCMVYFSPSVYNEAIKPYGYDTWAHLQDVWIAQYPYTETQDPGKTTPAIPDNLSWRIWQYGGGDVNFTAGRHAGADYGGGLQGIDLNYYNGTAQEMASWLGVGNVVIEPDNTPDVVMPSSVRVDWVANGGALVKQLLQVKVTVDAVQYICDVDQRPAPQVVIPVTTSNLYRIKDDIEAGWEPNGPRPFNRGLKGFPSTVRIEGGKSAMQLPLKWTEYLRTCMSAKAFKYTFKAASGWQNRATFGLVESLTFSGNIVEVLSVEGNRAYIKALRPRDTPPTAPISPRPGNLDSLVHLFSIQYTDHLDQSTDGRWAVTLCMVDDNNVRPWILLDNLVKL